MQKSTHMSINGALMSMTATRMCGKNTFNDHMSANDARVCAVVGDGCFGRCCVKHCKKQTEGMMFLRNVSY
jgi:hypothetical protein